MIAKYTARRDDAASPPWTPRPTSRTTRIFLWWFSIVMILTAGIAFVFKLIEFAYTALHQGNDALASFLLPVLNYLVVAAGFTCLFLWAYLAGQFRDVEQAKYRMLQMQEEIDRGEGSER